MTATETARLTDWLLNKGLSEKEVIECIKYIATGIQPNPQDPSKTQ